MFIGIVREGGHIYENRSIMLSLIQTASLVWCFSCFFCGMLRVTFCSAPMKIRPNRQKERKGEGGEKNKETIKEHVLRQNCSFGSLL